MKTRLNVVIVLDRSGSMRGSEEVTISAVNEYLVSLAAHESSDAYVTLTTFDSESIDTVFHCCAARDLRLAPEQFVPRAMTPLLDAVGNGIELLDDSVADGELAALVVLTDGLENFSKRFNKQQIRDLLRDRQEKHGWLVIFLGAEIDAWQGAREIGINEKRSLSFRKSKSAQMSDALQVITNQYVDCGNAEMAEFDDEMRRNVR